MNTDPAKAYAVAERLRKAYGVQAEVRIVDATGETLIHIWGGEGVVPAMMDGICIRRKDGFAP